MLGVPGRVCDGGRLLQASSQPCVYLPTFTDASGPQPGPTPIRAWVRRLQGMVLDSRRMCSKAETKEIPRSGRIERSLARLHLLGPMAS